jgi:hypothetical protein
MTGGNGAAATASTIPWNGLALYPLPLDREAMFLGCWFLLGVLALYAGFRWYSKKRWWLSALVLLPFALSFLSVEWLNRFRVYDFKNENPAITFVLPLYACSDAADYWPGGKFSGKADPGDITSLNEQPECFWSATSAIMVYLLATSATIASFLFLIGSLIRGIGGDHVNTNRLGVIIARFRKAIGLK